jgi:hypothetical protein
MSWALFMAGVGILIGIVRSWFRARDRAKGLDIEEALSKPDHTAAPVAKAKESAKGSSAEQLKGLQKDGADFDARQRARK